MPTDVDILEVSDISALADDFQADGTVAPGTTGRVADAGHVHPASPASVGYQIVTTTVSPTVPNGSGDYVVPRPITVTVDAPSGHSVVGGGYNLTTYGSPLDTVPTTNGPSSDGSSWVFEADFGVGPWGSDTLTLATVYAICIETS